MPLFTHTVELACSPETVFEFLAHPANIIQVTPPDTHPKLIEAPERVAVGAKITVQVRKFGIAQSMTNVVTAVEPPRLMRDEQVHGPFKKWIHSHILEAIPSGTKMTDKIEFEPPGGLLGFVVTESRILTELKELFAHRTKRFKELLDKPSAQSAT